MKKSWQRKFVDLANHVAGWSKDPSTQVGAVIVDPETLRVVSMGYNGFPRGVEDSQERLEDRETKYGLVVHAEVNALLQASESLRGKVIFLNVPMACNDCTKAIITAGISTIYVPAQDMEEGWVKRNNRAREELIRESGIRIIEV